MSAAGMPRVEINGTPASQAQLRGAALSGYGHFTAMQVRGRRVRGLRQHLVRLDTANRELFGAGLDGAAVREHIGHALGDDVADASIRVIVHDAEDGPSVMVSVRPPQAMHEGAWKLRSVPYQRSIAHIKHFSDFGQAYYRRLALSSGFDEALLTGQDGLISEGAITNIGFFDGTAITWPAAPALRGITMALIEPRLAWHGLPSRSCHVRLSDLRSIAGVFVTNSRGIAAVGQVDDLAVPVDTDLMRTLAEAYESAGWDEI